MITGLLCGGIALLWLSSTGRLQGYAISAVLMLYAIIGGTIALIAAFKERAAAKLC